MGIAYNTSVVRDGLLLHLDAANKKSYTGSGTTWSDLSGNNNSATLTNTPTYINLNNGYFSYNGTSNYSTNNLNLSSTSAITISVWLNFTSSSLMMLSEHSSNFNGQNAWLIDIAEYGGAGSLQFSDSNTSGYNICYTSPGYNNGKWHNFVVVCDRSIQTVSQTSLYVNGVKDTIQYASQTTILSGNFSNFTQYIGSRAGTQYFYNGYIADFKVYSRALSVSEIQKNFEALRGRYGL